MIRVLDRIVAICAAACMALALCVLVPALAFAEFAPADADSLSTQANGQTAILYDNGDLVFQFGTEPDSAHRASTSVAMFAIDSTIYDGETSLPPWSDEQYAASIKRAEVVEQSFPIPSGSMAWWFVKCVNLETVDISRVEASSVASMSNMFAGCESLVSVTLGDIDTSRVADFSDQFSGCSSLTTLDLSGINIRADANIDGMLGYCTALHQITLGSNSRLSAAVDLPETYEDDDRYTNYWQDGRSQRFPSAQGEENGNSQGFLAAIAEAADPAGTYTRESAAVPATKPCAILYDNGDLVFQMGSAPDASHESVEVVELYTGFMDAAYTVSDLPPWHAAHASDVKAALCDAEMPVTSAAYWFYNCTNLTTVNLDGLFTATAEAGEGETVDFSHLFDGCTSLSELNIEKISTTDEATVKMTDMLAGLPSLVRVKLGPDFRFSADCGFATAGSSAIADGYWFAADGQLLPTGGIDFSKGVTGAQLVAGYTGATSESVYMNGWWKLQAREPDPIDISPATITLSPTSTTYTGAEIRPSVTVRYPGITLTGGTDYDVAYSNNVKAGTATVTVTGKGDFTGTKTATFTITPASIAAATVALSPTSYTYDGAAKQPGVTVKVGSRTLTAGTDYTVSYSNNVNVGTATATVTGRGNYTGAKSAAFTIAAAPAPAPAPVTESVTVYRVYHTTDGEHFYTTSRQERDQILSWGGWNDEGVAWVVPSTSNTPVYRLYDTWTGEHHYTASAEERAIVLSWGHWNDEGIAWYSDDAQTMPVYRLQNSASYPHAHHYTLSANERSRCINEWGWRSEGTGWYALAAG